MFSQKELKRIERKKKALVARSDLLREECGEMWSMVHRRTRVIGESLGVRRRIHPTLMMIARTGLLYLDARYLSQKRYLAPLSAMANTLLNSSSRSTPDEPPAPGLYHSPEV